MDFVQTIIDWISAGVMLYGGVTALNGLTAYSEGKSQNNSTKKDEGMEKAIGGALIILIGLLLVPEIANMLPS